MESFCQPAVLYFIPACHRAGNTSGNPPEISLVPQNVSFSVMHTIYNSALTLSVRGQEGYLGCRKLASVVSLELNYKLN